MPGQGQLISYIEEPNLTEDQEELIERFENSGRDLSIYYIEVESLSEIEDSGRVSVLLPDKVTEFTFNARYVMGDSTNYSWYGIIDGYNDSTNSQFGTLTFIEREGQKFGFLAIDTLQYEIHDIGDSLNIMIEYESDSSLCGIDTSNNELIVLNSINSRSCPNLDQIDVLTIWTRKGALQILGNSTNAKDVIENTIRMAIENANNALRNSGIRANQVRFNLVAMEEVPFDPGLSIFNDLNKIVSSTTDDEAIEIRALREQYEADIVIVLVEQSYAGLGGSVLTEGSEGSSEHAYGIVHTVNALQDHIMVHEMAHLFGCQHQQCSLGGISCEDEGPAIAHGYRFNHGGFLGIGVKKFKTIMANYDRTTIPNFSNPNIKYKGHKTGVSGTNNNTQQILNESCDVSQYRGSISPSLIAGIDLHSTDCGFSNYRVVEAQVYGGGPNYSYAWSTSFNGFHYTSNLGSNSTQQIAVPEQGIFVKLVVTSGFQSFEAVRFLDHCSIAILQFATPDENVIYDTSNENIYLQVYPNPNVGENGIIKLTLEKDSYATLDLLNINGTKINTLKKGSFLKGTTEVLFENSRLNPCIYFIRVTTDSDNKIIKYIKL